MCGICGVAFPDADHRVDPAMLREMQEALVHRGPDDAGLLVAPGIGMGSRRLAIQDLSERGHMPMATDDGRFHIVYNGEVYNFQSLRRDLESRGETFRSATDTEVILKLFARAGESMLERLNGMFAFAIWDSKDRTLFLVRDRLGIKPLYHAVHEGALYFASEEKALFSAGVPARFDPEVWEELLCFRYIAGERTPFQGVRRLLPGHVLTWREGRVCTRPWWRLGERVAAYRQEAAPADLARWYRETFDSAVALRRISDVPIGVLLSGGLDSSSVAASLAAQSQSRVSSFTVRFAEPGYDEGPIAAEVVKKWRLEPHELRVDPLELLGLLQQASWLNDEPLAHGNDLHLLAISRFAKPRVTVLLSGEGGDETLGGYVRYRPLAHPAALAALRPLMPAVRGLLRPDGRMAKLARFLRLGGLDRLVLYNACDVLPFDLHHLGVQPRLRFEYRERLLAEARSLYPGEPQRQAMYLDQHVFLCSVLDRNDRMTMGASIECRVPFLDYRLVERLAALPTRLLLAGRGLKPLLRRALGDRLPEAVLRHRKWGFAVPWERYLRTVPELRDVVETLADTEPLLSGPFERTAVRRMAEAFLRGDARHQELVRELVLVTVWHRAYFERVAASRLLRNQEIS